MSVRLERFAGSVAHALTYPGDEAVLLASVCTSMRELVAHDDWLAPRFAVAHAAHYTQYLLHCDPAGRFSVVSFVWGPGQSTPIHDHTVWGVIGMLRGAEFSQAYERTPGGVLASGDVNLLEVGDVTCVSPRIGDIHQVRNAHADRVSVSIHVYGADIGQVRRHVFDVQTSAVKEFVSGYSAVSGISS